MSTAAIRIITGIVLMGHGIGHAMGILAVLGVKLSETHSPDSWLLTDLFGNSLTNIIGLLTWLLALLGFVGAGLGLAGWLVPHNWWQTLALSAAIISLVGLFFFWNAFPFLFPNKVGVICVDIAALICVLWLHWPPEIG
jgi:hypothetical protein